MSREVGVDRLPDLLMEMSRCTNDVAAVQELGARATARITGSTAMVVVRRAGSVVVAAIHDEDPGRRSVVEQALAGVPADPESGPFWGVLASGQRALLDIPALAWSGTRQAWAEDFDRLGIACMGLTPLLAGDHILGLLVTCRLGRDEPMTTDLLADQAEVAGHLATFLDTATALTQMRQSSLVVDAMPEAIIGFSRDREVILWNACAERMYGIPEADAIGQRLDDLIQTEYPPDRPVEPAPGAPATGMVNAGSWTGRVQQRTRDGRVLHADVSIASIVEGGFLRGAVSINKDISPLVQAEAQRVENERRMQALLDASRSMTAVFDRHGTVVAVNSAWQAAAAEGSELVTDVEVGASYLDCLRAGATTSADAAAVLAGLEAVLSGRAPSFEWDYDLRRADGATTAYMVSVAPMPGADGGAFATHTDISTRKAMERQLAHQASHDALTGLRTRRRVEQDLAGVLAGTADVPVGVIVADLDRFTDVNDTLGHDAGDRVLVEMAARLRTFPGATVIGRLSGDEFALVVPGVRDRSELRRLAGDVSRLISAPLAVADRELFFGVTIGTALSSDTPGGADSAANLLRAADTAMSRAKARGRNAIVAFDDGLRADVERRLQVSTWLNRALERGELHVDYQPQFRCLDGRQVGAEACLRWQHPEAGEIPAAEFLAVAEESGAIVPIGTWVLGEACLRAADWASASGLPELGVAVNVSPHQLTDPGLPDVVRSALMRSRLSASCLTLEVTEGALVEEPTAACEALARLRALGVRISLDDFGTGYSSLAYLSRFPVDELKVGQAFVRDVERDPRSRALAEGIVRIGHALGARVVAEGLTTPGQLRILTGIGVDCYQGPLSGGPEPPAEAAMRIRDRASGTDGVAIDLAGTQAGRRVGWE